MAFSEAKKSYTKAASFNYGDTPPGGFGGYRNAVILKVLPDVPSYEFTRDRDGKYVRGPQKFWPLKPGQAEADPKLKTPILAWIEGISDPTVTQDDGVRLFLFEDYAAITRATESAARQAGRPGKPWPGDVMTVGYSRSNLASKAKNWADHATYQLGSPQTQAIAAQKLAEHEAREQRLAALEASTPPSIETNGSAGFNGQSQGFAGQVHDTQPAATSFAPPAAPTVLDQMSPEMLAQFAAFQAAQQSAQAGQRPGYDPAPAGGQPAGVGAGAADGGGFFPSR